MKTIKFYFLVFFICCPLFIQATNNYRVVRGERPAIDYSRVAEDAWEKGVLVIKFNSDYERHLEAFKLNQEAEDLLSFGLKSLDLLNEANGIKSISQHFQSGALKDNFTERHRAWGFHLWYRLELDEKADIISLLEAYKSLDEIEVARPEFHKILIGSETISSALPAQNMQTQNNNSWIPNDPQFSSQWNYNNTGQSYGVPGADIRLPAAWSVQKGNPEVIVAVIDTGVDQFHQDLAGNMWPGIGYSFVSDEPTVIGGDHGTHVAGTVAAVNNNNTGVSGIAGGSGQNDGVRIMSCEVFRLRPGGMSYWAAGFNIAPVWAADNGAAISQNSWGYVNPGVYEEDVLDAIDYFNINGGGEVMNGGITIAAAGNSHSSEPFYPGYYSGVMAVAATGNDDRRALYSNYGSYIDISAPGGAMSGGILSTFNANKYGEASGTSMACPHVSGVAALILSAASSDITPDEVLELLKNTADDISAVNSNMEGQLGTGRLNAYLAVANAENFPNLASNPLNFSAVSPNESQISLSWQLNEENNPVILVWSENGKFGLPQPGSVYQPGDNLEGGGTILYKGSNLSFDHTGLSSNTLYNYRLWSVNELNNYSLGLSSNIYSACGAMDLPFYESFDFPAIPQCWNYPPGNFPYPSHVDISFRYGSPPPSVGFGMAIRDSLSLESIALNGNVSENGIALEFDLLYVGDFDDGLNEFYSEVFDGSQWVEILKLDNSEGLPQSGSFYIDITSHALNTEFKIRFITKTDNIYGNVHHWYLDNFSVFPITCRPPQNLSGEDITPHSILLSWDVPDDFSTWDVIYGEPGFDPISQGTLVEQVSDNPFLLDGLIKHTFYDVYIRTHCSQGDESVWIGPLSFETLPTCPAPVDLQVDHITNTTADFNWQSEGQEDIWQIKYGEPGFDPETNGNFIDHIMQPSYLLGGLHGATSYEVYVRAFCGVDDESRWTQPLEFRTKCDTIILPYTEGFNDPTTECWTFPQGRGSWLYTTSNPPPSSISGSPHASFSWSPLQTEYSFPLTSYTLHASEPDEPVKISYVLYLNSYNNINLEQLSVEYKVSDESDWTLLKNYTNEGLGNGNGEFREHGLVLDGMQGELFQVRFRAHGQNTFSILAWSLDDVYVYQGYEDCPEPLALSAGNISHDSATLLWESEGLENSWDILWGQEGFDPQTQGTLVEGVSQNPWILEGLQPLTDYEFYIKAVCNIIEQSQWSGPAGFSTIDIPYIITVTTEGPGSVQPTGDLAVQPGTDLDMEFSAHEGAHIADVMLDGESVLDQIITQRDTEFPEWGRLLLHDIMADHDIHVNFALNFYDLFLSAQPSDGGTISGEGSYTHFTQVEINAVPSEGFIFVNWTEDDQVISQDQQHVIQLLRPMNLVANFQSTTSAGNLPDYTNVNIYPNPANDILWVELAGPGNSDVKVSVLSIHGHEIKREAIAAGNTQISFNLTSLNSGIYFVNVNNGQIVRKVIVKK